MERAQLSREVSLSRIVYGMWRLHEDDPSPAGIRAKIDACLETGVTSLDQADIYGGYTSESLLGGAIKETPGIREKIEIVSKCGILAPTGRFAGARVKHYDTSSTHIERQIDQSLRNLETEYLDLLLIHRPDPMMDHEETGRALDNAIASGKVRAVGVSNFKPWDFTLLQSAMSTELVVNQIELSLSANEAFTNGDLAFLQQHKVYPMAWSPAGGGALLTGDPQDGQLQQALHRIASEQGKSIADIAIAWLLAHPARILPVMGSNKPDRIRNFSNALNVEINRETWFELYTAAIGHEVP